MTTEYDIEEPYWKIEQHAKDLAINQSTNKKE